MKEINNQSQESTMHIHRKLFGLAGNVHGFFSGLAILSFLLSVVVVLQMYFLSLIIAEVFMASEFTRPNLLYLLLATIFLRSVFIWVREKFAQNKAVIIKSKLRRNLFQHMLNLGPSFTKATKTGELIASLMEGVEKLDDYFTRYIPSIIHITILPTVVIVFTLLIDWPSGLILLFTAPLILFFMWLIGTYAKKLTRDQWAEMSSLSSHFLDVLQGMKTLKIFGRSRQEAESVDIKSNNFRIITMRVLKMAFLSGLVLELAASISIALVAVQVGIRLIEGMMTFQPGLFVLLLAPEFYLPFRTLGLHHHAGMEGSAAARNIFQRTENQPDLAIAEKASGKENLFAPTNTSLPLQVTNIWFTYPQSSTPVLKGMDCQLSPGTLTAVVGPTGSGKTTFAHILLGFLQPNMGHIFWGDTPLTQINPDQWRQQVAYVPQHPHFFNASILDNLRMANPDTSQDEVKEAAQKAGAHHFVEQLPRGYQTHLTENASRLSGGEKQRLAIARAFLKDAALLILDEPTSNLDPESEQYVAEATQRIVKNRTTLVIAHRLKTVQNADNILVFQDGKIAESGSHRELVNRNGAYAGYLATLGLI